MAPAKSIQPAATKRNKYIASLLALTVGIFGIHQFYLGNKKVGKEFLFTCIFIIPIILAFFQGIGLLFMSQQKFDEKYNMKHCIDCDEDLGIMSTETYCSDCAPSSSSEKLSFRSDDSDSEIYIDSKGNLVSRTDIKKKNQKSLKVSPASTKETLDDIMKEMDELVGLEGVKEEISTLVNFIKVQKQREKAGLQSSTLSYHMVFTGNPGTGKTTVARIISRIYKQLGILDGGHLTETDRSGLIAEYEGQTAVKVNDVVDAALDGILFIDEAYALNLGHNETYGKEAVATIIKRMEDDREKLVVILAGYTGEMKTFIETNPGFESRINRYINFPDYKPEDLVEIFKRQCAKADYTLTSDAENKVKDVFAAAYAERDQSFGNARFARNVFENAMELQSNRLASGRNLSKSELCTLIPEDIEAPMSLA